MIAYTLQDAAGLELAAFLLLISWGTIVHLHRTLNTDTTTQEGTMPTTYRPLAHYSRERLEMRLEHLRELEAADAPRTDSSPLTRQDVIARIEIELEIRDLWQEGR